MFEKRLKEINTRRGEIRSLLEGTGEADLDALTRELDDLDKEEADIQRKITALDRLNRGGVTPNPAPGAPNPIAGVTPENRGGMGAAIDHRAAELADLQGIRPEEAEARAVKFAETPKMQITTDALKRSLTLSSGTVAQPTRVSGINPAQNEVSGLIDMVYVVDAAGMGKDSVAYETSIPTANVKKDDGTATTGSDTGFAIAEITPVLVSTLSYVSRNIQKTTPLNYQQRTSVSSLNALRKKVSRLIVSGNPAATVPEITGILKAAAIASGSDIEIVSIDATTLRKITLAYGGDDNVEGGGVLILNKKDLIAFGDIRGTNEKKAVYEITFDPGSTTTGTIKDGGLSAMFCINNELSALSDAATEAGTYSMIYGKPLAYQLDLFGPYEIEVSRDYKFAEGLLAVMGEVMVGGNVVSENGFIRAKKKAAG